jgi:hypothetical protein
MPSLKIIICRLAYVAHSKTSIIVMETRLIFVFHSLFLMRFHSIQSLLINRIDTRLCVVTLDCSLVQGHIEWTEVRSALFKFFDTPVSGLSGSSLQSFHILNAIWPNSILFLGISRYRLLNWTLFIDNALSFCIASSRLNATT